MNLSQRSTRKEILDDPEIPKEALIASLQFMEGVNRLFGGISAILNELDPKKTPKAFTVLDIGTGSGDMAEAICLWGRKHRKTVQVTAIDISEDCLDYARLHHPDSSIRYINHSAFDIEDLGSFDYVVSSMFFHHLKDEQIVELLKKIDSVSRMGFLVNDLHRSHLGVLSALLLSLISFRWTVIHDATLSVMRAFRPDELRKLIPKEMRNTSQVKKKPWFRIVISNIEREE